MTFPRFEPAAVPLFQYTLASMDMYYAELEQRRVFIGSDENQRVKIWAESASGGPSRKAELCRIFLEYSLYCNSWCNPAEAHYHMQRFGEKLGKHLASYLKKNPEAVTGENPAIGALECLFGSIGACYSLDYVEAGMRFLVTQCPLEEAAKGLGLPHVELARHGINAMCRRMLFDMSPGLIVSTSPESSPQFMFTIGAAVPA